jgi:ketosteroid isomerase-like protein
MRSWLARKLVERQMAALRAGDCGPTLKMDADDVCLHFPGESSWAGDIRGKEAHGAWLARFIKVGLKIYADEVMVMGPLWHMRIGVRGRTYLHAPDGTQIYENRYVLWGHLWWGRLADYEVYEDTVKSLALDDYLAIHEPAT